MRIAILSDIHSNLQALTKALEVIDELGVDEICCLGDIVGYGANPNECVELVRTRAAKCVAGNHDVAVVDPLGEAYLDRNGRTAVEWTRRILTQEHRKFLAGLPFAIRTETMTLVHSNPAEPGAWTRIETLDDARSQFEYFDTPLCFIGHTHVPFVCGEDLKAMQVHRGMKFLVNVGSIGQPRDGESSLSLGVFDDRTWEYRNVRMEYDVGRAAEEIKQAGLPTALADRLVRGI